MATVFPAPALKDDPIGVYLHVPFCAHICPYCDFATYAGQESLIPAYVDAVVADIRAQAVAVAGRSVESIFLGGGTPSLLEPEQVVAMLDAIRTSLPVLPDAEITLEANPNSSDAGRFAGYREAGVNRLSIGVQTLERKGLRVLGRQHEADDALAAVRAAREAGIGKVSLDLIFGWSGQTTEQLLHDLDTVLGWDGGPEHLSLYSLIVEPGTPMADAVDRGILKVPDDDLTADMYEAAQARFAAEGWQQYEVANFALSEDHQSRHNARYWRNGDYLGIGAAAHGTVGGLRTMNHLHPRAYIDAIRRGNGHASNREEIDAATAMGETMMLGLRLVRDGVDAGRFAERHGVALDEVYGTTIDRFVRQGLMERTGTGVRLTKRGLMVANDVVAAFLPEVGKG